MIQIHAPRFALGRLIATPAALAAIAEEGMAPFEFVARHVRGDHGDLDEHDRLANAEAMWSGGRILSVYPLAKAGKRLWCLTEATDDRGHRAVTTLLLDVDY